MTDALADVRLPTPNGAARLGDLRARASLPFSAEWLRQVDPDVFTPLPAGQWLDGFDHESLWPRVECPNRLVRHRHIRFDGVGHQIHRTRPDEVVAALNTFAAEPATKDTPNPGTTPRR